MAGQPVDDIEFVDHSICNRHAGCEPGSASWRTVNRVDHQQIADCAGLKLLHVQVVFVIACGLWDLLCHLQKALCLADSRGHDIADGRDPVRLLEKMTKTAFADMEFFRELLRLDLIDAIAT